MVETLVNPFSGLEAKAKQPINEDLTDKKFKENIEGLLDSINNISVGGGDADSGMIGEITLGGEDNAPRYWKRRFSPLQHILNADSKNPSGFDPEAKSLKNELLTFIQSNDAGLSIGINPNNYLGERLNVAKSSKISFKIKKGVNFFSIGSTKDAGFSDSITVMIDNATPTSLGLEDENGGAAPNTFSTNVAGTFLQDTVFFYGLDGEEHIITLENTDSASKLWGVGFIEVGYRSPNPTIDESTHINTGKATVRGTEVTFADEEFEFAKLDLNGHTGAIVCDTLGALSKLDGECPAMTQVKPEEAVIFSAPVTQLPVKNTFYFPDNGICLLSTPYGNHHLFSFNGKTDASIQAHSLDNLLWQSQPTEDFTPLAGFTSATIGDATGDLNINYWGTAPILIDGTNNKLDFEITIGGVTTTHAATIASGRYAADLVPLEAAIRAAMQVVKPINGEYHIKYSSESQLWNIYVEGNEIEAFSLLLSTGLNQANSVHSTIGFADTDLTGALSYLANTEVQHLCCKALEADKVFMYSEDPRIKYSSGDAGLTDGEILDVQERLGLGQVRSMSGGSHLMQIFPDDDCCGLEVSFLQHNECGMLTFQVDDGQCLYLLQEDTSVVTSIRGSVTTAFISFPRGSRKITIREEDSPQFSLATNTVERVIFVGARQYFTKPAYEKLTKSQAVIKTFDISPVSLYATVYGHNGGTLYSPAASNDSINTITENLMTGALATNRFNSSRRRTATVGGYIEIDFTLQGDGGGIAIKTGLSGVFTRKAALFISQAVINEGTDRIQNNHMDWAANYFDQNAMQSMGLRAGTYKARFKCEHAGEFENSGIVIYDIASPQENANTVADIANTGQSIAYPINVMREVIMQDSDKRVPSWLQRSGYMEGKKSLVNYSLSGPNWINYDDTVNLIDLADGYYGSRMEQGTQGFIIQVSGFMKFVSLKDSASSVWSVNLQPFIDGIQTLNNYSQRTQVKGGSAPSVTRTSALPLSQKEFKLSCALNSGLTYTIADTRGLKNDRTIILDDGANKEKVVVASFIVGTSFTIKKAPSVVIPANVTDIEFQGFHTYKILQNDSNAATFTCFEYEPLKVSPSKAIQRRSTVFTYEKVEVTNRELGNGDSTYYPVHSDGVVGNWTTSTIQVIGKTAASSFSLGQDLKNISIGAGSMSLKISSERLVPVLDEKERF